MTAMHEAKKLTEKNGHVFTIFTADQQLNCYWAYPTTFINFVPPCGAMHMLMEHGTISTLMANSDPEEILKVAFGGVATTLTGKKYCQNLCALRMVMNGEEVLCELIKEAGSEADINDLLHEKAQQSKTAKLWVECLLKSILITFL